MRSAAMRLCDPGKADPCRMMVPQPRRTALAATSGLRSSLPRMRAEERSIQPESLNPVKWACIPRYAWLFVIGMSPNGPVVGKPIRHLNRHRSANSGSPTEPS
jgi:hypothetical protein